ncbi:S-layer family protein [bacterium]|nr:S-layer family protein [bacterium]
MLIAGIRTREGSQGSQAGNIVLDALDTIEIVRSEVTNSISIDSVGRGGNIQISSNSLKVEDSPLQAFSLGQGDVGDILIEVDELASFNGAGVFTQNGVPINLGSLAIGNSGEITIRSGSLLLANGSTLSTSTFGIGNAGSIQIEVDEGVFVNDSSAIFNDVGALRFNQGVVGEGGDIRISSSQLRLSNNSGLQTATFAQGNAGSITLDIRENVLFENDSLTLSNVESTGIGRGGNISISANNVAVINGSQLAAGTRGQGDAGSILINAGGNVSFNGAGRFLLGGAFSSVESTGFGNGGNITIFANNLLVENEAQLAAGTRGIGNAGSIFIKVADTVLFDDGAAFSTVEDRQARGNGGDIRIVASTFVAENSSQLVAATNGIGNAGNIIIETSDSTTFDGVSNDGNRPSAAISAVLSQGNGDGGTIKINSGDLFLTDGGRLLTETRNRGNAGNVDINSDSVTINGINENSGRRSGIFSGTTPRSVGQGGIIFIDTSTLEVSDGGLISARTENLRNGGEIIVNASNINLNNQAIIEALSTNLGNAGDIRLDLRNQLTAKNSRISTTSTFGAGGQIDIVANGIVLIGNSDIQTFVESGAGGGGNITITGNFIIALNDSDILAFASRGAGGNITLQTPGFFGENFTLDSLTADPATLDGNDRVDINATGAVNGVVTIPNISFIENSLVNLQDFHC